MLIEFTRMNTIVNKSEKVEEPKEKVLLITFSLLKIKAGIVRWPGIFSIHVMFEQSLSSSVIGGNASKYASILSVPFESELDFTTKIETFSDRIEVKEEYDDFVYEEAIEKRNNVEYSKNKEVDQISDHVENDFNSNLDIKLEPTEDDQSRPKIHL